MGRKHFGYLVSVHAHLRSLGERGLSVGLGGGLRLVSRHDDWRGGERGTEEIRTEAELKHSMSQNHGGKGTKTQSIK